MHGQQNIKKMKLRSRQTWNVYPHYSVTLSGGSKLLWKVCTQTHGFTLSNTSSGILLYVGGWIAPRFEGMRYSHHRRTGIPIRASTSS